jgi:MerR family transcriptional regulator, mercuric resistance operon regulatory protein
MDMTALTISRFAAAGGVGVETVRFYQRRGLLGVPERQGPGYREYSEADQQRLAFICRARELGFTLSEIRDLLGPAETGFTGDILQAARAKLEQVHEQVTELTRLRGRLHQLVRVCEDGDGEDCLALRLGRPVSHAGMP